MKRSIEFGPKTSADIIEPQKIKKKSVRGRASLEKLRKDGYKHFPGIGFYLDKHWRPKPKHFVMILGHTNVGKSAFTLYLITCISKHKKWRWNVWLGENDVKYAYASIAQMYLDKKLAQFTDEDLTTASDWIDTHFTFIDNDELSTYGDLINFCKANPADGLFADPFNAMADDVKVMKVFGNKHQHDYRAIQEFRSLSRTMKMSVYITMHSISESQRRRYKDGHEYAGYQMPPYPIDQEGGGKFSNACDDFLIVHRMIGHPEHKTRTEVYVTKIRYTETGGEPTSIDSPVYFKYNGYGFEDEYGNNPLRLVKEDEIIFEDAPF